MGKKRKKHYVPPRYHVGESVLFRGNVEKIEKVYDEPTGNRPRYRLVGLRSIYSESYLRDLIDDSEG